jgi:hypothetical protein
MSSSTMAHHHTDPILLARKATTKGTYLSGGHFGDQCRNWYTLSDQIIVVEGQHNEARGFVSSIEEMLRCFSSIGQY